MHISIFCACIARPWSRGHRPSPRLSNPLPPGSAPCNEHDHEDHLPIIPTCRHVIPPILDIHSQGPCHTARSTTPNHILICNLLRCDLVILHRRNGIEGTQSELVRGYGLRQARYRGKDKVRLQNHLIGAACNIRRLFRRLAWEANQACRAASVTMATVSG